MWRWSFFLRSKTFWQIGQDSLPLLATATNTFPCASCLCLPSQPSLLKDSKQLSSSQGYMLADTDSPLAVTSERATPSGFAEVRRGVGAWRLCLWL